MDQLIIEKMIKEILNNMKNEEKKEIMEEKVDITHYPLGNKRPDLLKTPTNKSISDITLDNIVNENITIEDLKITPETLELQAQIAESAGRESLARNFRRAAELTKIPDKRVLEIYDSLRPFRSTKQELLDIAEELEKEYGAIINAEFIREAAQVYENRKKLKI